MDITIRSASVSDHDELAPLFDDLDRLHRENAPWLLQEPDRDPRPRAWLEERLADPSSAILVADAGQIAGLATVRLRDAPHFPLFIPQRRAVIDDLIVHPDWRRKGIARVLYDAAERWARDREAAWLEVSVYDFNTEAREFYEAVGFRTTMRKMRKPLEE